MIELRRVLLVFGIWVASAPAAMASTPMQQTLEELIEGSAAVVRMRVTELDATAYDSQEGAAYTRLSGDVVEVLIGEGVEASLSFLFRGGVHPDGAIESWDAPAFEVGETYLMFLSGDYPITPFVAVYQEVLVQGSRVLVNDEGRILEWTGDYPEFGKAVTVEPAVMKSRGGGEVMQSPRRDLVRGLPTRFQTEGDIIEKVRTRGKRVTRRQRALPSRPKALNLETSP